MALQVKNMLEEDIIEFSNSPWCSPAVMVRKPNGSFRLCLDFRQLNSVTKPDAFPIPRIEDILSSLHGSTIFSALDMKSGFWQFPLRKQDREKTAFICGNQLYQFKVMPFGVMNGSASFQRLMTQVLGDCLGRNAYVYCDDVIVFSKDKDSHGSDLREILDCFKVAGLTVNPDKCRFGQREMQYLGHRISKDGISVDSEKIQAV